MTKVRRNIAIAAAALVGAVVTFFVLSDNGVFDVEIWMREHPLVDPIPVAGVKDGTITLIDGRTFRPAGISPCANVSPEAYDLALRTFVAQGVVVIRDLGDGRAFLMAEPLFYNWCGTRNYKGNPWARWAGSYLPCPLSESLVHSAYAEPDLHEVGLTPMERWRLEGAEHMFGFANAARRVTTTGLAVRYDGGVSELIDYDHALELAWKPPPPQ